MKKSIAAHIYDYPHYYDLLFGSDWKAEFDFLQACFQKHAARPVKRLFEPACGTGRLLIKFAQAGYLVAGNDLNAKAVAYCNARLARHGFAFRAEVGDMANFYLPRPVDAAFNTINSFRHLPDETAARNHLQCVAGALARGGIYVLGLHLTPRGQPSCDRESWSAQRGYLSILSQMWSIATDRRKRQERVGMTFDVATPTQSFRLDDEMLFRTYTRRQFDRLAQGIGPLELLETYDFAYQIDQPVPVDDATEDVVYVFRKKR